MTDQTALAYDVFAELARLEGLASGAFCQWPRRTWRSHILTSHLILGLPVGMALLWIVVQLMTGSSA
jgi:hypothetical protein